MELTEKLISLQASAERRFKRVVKQYYKKTGLKEITSDVPITVFEYRDFCDSDCVVISGTRIRFIILDEQLARPYVTHKIAVDNHGGIDITRPENLRSLIYIILLLENELTK